MKQIFILLFLSLSNIYSQSFTLTGKVLSAESMTPLQSANVFLESGMSGVTTNMQGVFNLSLNSIKDDKLIVKFLGFKTYVKLLSEIDFNKELLVILENEILPSQTVLVTGTFSKVASNPITSSIIKRTEIQKNYQTQDVPEFLSYTPSVNFYSEGGNNLGYNYLSIRGFEQRRISVAVNGIPQNDPEDHNVYWLDLPDLLASTEMIQIQRGAGSGIIGYPAIGGAVNIVTSSFSDKSFLDISSSFGSYNTRKYSTSFSSGLVDNKYSFYAKLSNILSSGYRDNSWVDFKSYHFSAIRFDEFLTTQINIYGGPVADGLVYTGLPKFAIKDKNLRKKNFSYWEADQNEITFAVERRPEELENFSQPHFEIFNEFRLDENITLNSALFFIKGDGFFDFDGSWADTNYLRLNSSYGFYPASNPGNTVIRANVENRQFGWIPRIQLLHKNGTLIVGGEFRLHNSLHWGAIKYADNLPSGITQNYRYYEYNGVKDIFTFYAHENYNLNEKINLLGEIQVSYHKYKIKNEKYVNTDFSINNIFFNPRFGVNFKLNTNTSFYVNFAKVTREPRLKNYYDAAESSGGAVPQFSIQEDNSFNYDDPIVKPEIMYNIELGNSLEISNLFLNMNLYYMYFNNEIVKDGKIDRFGNPTTGNMDNTTHYGFEFSGKYSISPFFEFITNLSFSKNYISAGETFFNYGDGSVFLNLTDNSIAGFSDFMMSTIASFQYNNINLRLSARYIGDFFTDNYDNKIGDYLKDYPGFIDYTDNKVEAYFVANLFFSINFDEIAGLKKIKFIAQINNIFDNLYASHGVGKEFYPAAERNFLIGIQTGL